MDVPDKLVVLSGQQARIELSGNTGDITAGGNGRTGDVLLKDPAGEQRIHVGLIWESGGPIDPTHPPPMPLAYWGLRVQNDAGASVIELGRGPVQPPLQPDVGPSTVSFNLGGGGQAGIVHLLNASNQQTVSLEAEGGIRLLAGSHPVVRMEAGTAAVFVGGNGKIGDINVFSSAGDNTTTAQATIVLNGNGGKITLKSDDHKDRVFIDGSKGNVWLGGKDAQGDLMLFDKDEQDNRDSAKATVHLAGDSGRLVLRSSAGEDRVLVDGKNGDIWLGGKSVSGDIMLFHKDEQKNRDSGNATIRLDGGKGDIILRNADCAEDFDIAGDAAVEPGTVMVIDNDGRLRPSSRPYDRCVAGVLSGAGDIRPGIVLGRQEGASARHAIALAGRVWCRVEASTAPIETGDLLTTSSLSGVAMKALEPARAFGAVIGKALAPLALGQGLIPILVALQ